MSMIAERTVNLSVEDAAREFADTARQYHRYVPGDGWQYHSPDGWVSAAGGDDLADLAADVYGPTIHRAIRPLLEAVLVAAAPLMTEVRA